MKRFYLFAIAMVSALSMLAETSIQNTFFGCTLGKSTSKEVQAAMVSQGLDLLYRLDSTIVGENSSFGIQLSSCEYEGNYNYEEQEFHSINVIFWNDTLFAITMRENCNENCFKYAERVQANLDKRYGHLEIADSTLLFKQMIDIPAFYGNKIWSRHDEHTMVVTFLSDSTFGCLYANGDAYYKLIILGMKQLEEEFYNLPNYCEKNKVYGVAGVKFGDDRETVRRTIGLKSDRLLDSDSHMLQFYETKIGGTTYQYATFYFIQGKLVSISLQKPFYSWQKEEALMAFENVKSQYERKYSNLTVLQDEYEEKLCTCGAFIDGYDYKPIIIAFNKQLSKGGNIMYYIIVSYYGMKKENLYDDEI